MTQHNDIVTLTEEEIKELIDRECRKRLGMDAAEFLRRRERGELEMSTAVHDIELLFELA